MRGEPWAWDPRTHPRVVQALADSTMNLDWCDRLETAATNAIVGKVLCVCAALAIARKVLNAGPEVSPVAKEAVELLCRWIDDPTEERFDQISAIIFGDPQPELDPERVVWWALRTATSSVGNYEAGWALSAVCDAAGKAGLSPDQLRIVVERELISRSRTEL